MQSVLVVEDQADIRKLIRMSLETEPYELHEASDGVSALALARQHRPKLVLLDVMMPGDLNGLQVCQRIKTDPDLAHAKVLLLSARGQDSDRQAGVDVGADEYLTKPFSPMHLIATVERLMSA